MAAEWWFYHVGRSTLDAAVGPLLEKCLERSWRVVIAGEADTVSRLDAALWTWRDDSFIPHGRTGAASAKQPVLLSTEADPANGAKVAVLLDGKDADATRFDRCLVVFEDVDEKARGKAREQFKAARDSGAVARYFQQDGQGAWVERKLDKPAAEAES